MLFYDLELVFCRLMVLCGFGLRKARDAEVVLVADILGAAYANLLAVLVCSWRWKARCGTCRGGDVRRADIADILGAALSAARARLLLDDSHGAPLFGLDRVKERGHAGRGIGGRAWTWR